MALRALYWIIGRILVIIDVIKVKHHVNNINRKCNVTMAMTPPSIDMADTLHILNDISWEARCLKSFIVVSVFFVMEECTAGYNNIMVVAAQNVWLRTATNCAAHQSKCRHFDDDEFCEANSWLVEREPRSSWLFYFPQMPANFTH